MCQIIASNAIHVKPHFDSFVAFDAYQWRAHAVDHCVMVSKKTIGRAIDQLRIARGMNKKELADKTGIDAGNLNRIISGTQEATLDRLQSLATVFGVRISDIIRMAETGEPEDSRKTALIRLVENLPIADIENVFRRPSNALSQHNQPTPGKKTGNDS